MTEPETSLADRMAQVVTTTAAAEAPPASLSEVKQRDQQMQANTTLANELFASMAIYNLILPAKRGSVESLLDLTFAPMRIYHGPVPWIQRPSYIHGTGHVDPVSVRDAIYSQRFTGTMPPIKLPRFDDTESLEEYIAMLEAQVEQAATSNPYGYTFEEQNLTHLRLLAAHDLLTLRTADKTLGLHDDNELTEVMEKFRISERALRALNAINRSRPDSRPPHLLTSDPATGWWFVLSDDLMVTYMLEEGVRVHRSKDAFVSKKNDGRLNLMRTTPYSIFCEIQQRLGRHVDELFPIAPASFGSIRSGRNRNRCISIGLLPLVMAFMDNRFLHLNPVRAVCQYVLNVVRPQLHTLSAPSLYYDASVQQLSHNIDWCAQLDSTTESNVVYATHLYSVAHQSLMTRLISKQRAALVVCRDFISKVTDAETAQKVMDLACTYGDKHATLMSKGQSIVAEFEENIFRDTHHVHLKKPRSRGTGKKRGPPSDIPGGANPPASKRARPATMSNIRGAEQDSNNDATSGHFDSAFDEMDDDDDDDNDDDDNDGKGRDSPSQSSLPPLPIPVDTSKPRSSSPPASSPQQQQQPPRMPPPRTPSLFSELGPIPQPPHQSFPTVHPSPETVIGEQTQWNWHTATIRR